MVDYELGVAILGLVSTLITLAAYVFVAVVLWRMMKALESLARSARNIATTTERSSLMGTVQRAEE